MFYISFQNHAFRPKKKSYIYISKKKKKIKKKN